MLLHRLLGTLTVVAFCSAIPAAAETVACPDLSTAVQVGACPSEDELQFTFTGYCSDNARIYNWHEETVCTQYELYRKLKNVVLWEAKNGDFQGYLSCDLPADRIKAAKPTGIEVSKLGRMTRVACGYGDGITFAHRTKAQCKVEGAANCAGGICQATCN